MFVLSGRVDLYPSWHIRVNLGHRETLIWGQIFKLTFRGRHVYPIRIFDASYTCVRCFLTWDWEEWEESLTELLLTTLGSEKVDAPQATSLHEPSTWQCHTQGAEPAAVMVSGARPPLWLGRRDSVRLEFGLWRSAAEPWTSCWDWRQVPWPF